MGRSVFAKAASRLEQSRNSGRKFNKRRQELFLLELEEGLEPQEAAKRVGVSPDQTLELMVTNPRFREEFNHARMVGRRKGG